MLNHVGSPLLTSQPLASTRGLPSWTLRGKAEPQPAARTRGLAKAIRHRSAPVGRCGGAQATAAVTRHHVARGAHRERTEGGPQAGSMCLEKASFEMHQGCSVGGPTIWLAPRYNTRNIPWYMYHISVYLVSLSIDTPFEAMRLLRSLPILLLAGHLTSFILLSQIF